MKTIQALEAALGDLLIEHRHTQIPGAAYEDLAIDLADLRSNRSNPTSIDRLVTSTATMLDGLRAIGQTNTRTFDIAVRNLDAVRNELRGPAVAQMADAFLEAVRTLDEGAMIDDLVVCDNRTFAIDAMVNAETLGRLLLEAADRIRGN